MHRALSIREIVETIVSQCSLTTLNCLGRTSRHFYQPCMAAIWTNATEAHLNKMQHLFLHQLIEEVPSDQRISMDDVWSQIENYCTLVRTMRLCLFTFAPLAGSFLPRLTLLRPAGHIFPRLRSLTFQLSREEDLSSLLLFVGPSLEKLDITMRLDSFVSGPEEPEEYYLAQEHERHIVISTLLYRLKTTAPALKEFGLFGIQGDQQSHCYLDALASFVENTPRLTKFGSDCYTLTSGVFVALATLPRLLEWVVRPSPWRKVAKRSGGTITDLVSTIREDFFSSLQSFDFSGEIHDALILLKLIPSTLDLMRFNLSTIHRFSPRFISKFAAAIDARAAPSSFRLELAIIERLGRAFREPAFSFGLLTPILQQCRSVTSFHFEYRSDRPFDFNNSHLAAIAEAWPHLRTLIIQWYRDSFWVTSTGLLHKSDLTFDGVLDLVTRSKLSVLALSELDTTTLPSPGPQRPSMQLLQFSDELVRNVAEVANFIESSFPKAKVMDGYRNERGIVADRDHGTWGRVQDAVRRLRGKRPTSKFDPPLIEHNLGRPDTHPHKLDKALAPFSISDLEELAALQD